MFEIQTRYYLAVAKYLPVRKVSKLAHSPYSLHCHGGASIIYSKGENFNEVH